MPHSRRSPMLEKLVAGRDGAPQQAVLAELRRVILDGGAPPGTQIPPAEVAELRALLEDGGES